MITLKKISLMIVAMMSLHSALSAVEITHKHVLGRWQLQQAARCAASTIGCGVIAAGTGLSAFALTPSDLSTEGLRKMFVMMSATAGVGMVASGIGAFYLARAGYRNIAPLAREILKNKNS